VDGGAHVDALYRRLDAGSNYIVSEARRALDATTRGRGQCRDYRSRQSSRRYGSGAAIRFSSAFRAVPRYQRNRRRPPRWLTVAAIRPFGPRWNLRWAP
jgi:hypothetical protein